MIFKIEKNILIVIHFRRDTRKSGLKAFTMYTPFQNWTIFKIIYEIQKTILTVINYGREIEA